MSFHAFLTVMLFLVLILVVVRYVLPLVNDNPDKRAMERLKRETKVFRDITKAMGRSK